MVITGNDYSQAVTELLSAYNYRTKEEERKKKNRDKYKDNITVIENMFKLKDNYPVSYKRIEEHLNILAILNKEGLNNLQGDICMFQEEAVFFASTRHIADLVELDKVDSIKICHRKVCKIINLLCLLGFIKKLKENDIPKKMLERGNQISKDKGWRRINYYIINPITPMLLDAAEEMSRRLSEGVDLGNISYNTIKKRLGEDVADKVYPNYIKTDSFKSAKKNENNTYSIKLIEPEDFLLCPPF